MPNRLMVSVISTDRNGKRIRYASVKEAAAAVGVSPCRISTACVTGNRCAGRHWEKEVLL